MSQPAVSGSDPVLPFRVAVGGAVGGLVGGNGQEREDQEGGDDPAKEQELGPEVDGHQGGEKDERTDHAPGHGRAAAVSLATSSAETHRWE